MTMSGDPQSNAIGFQSAANRGVDIIWAFVALAGVSYLLNWSGLAIFALFLAAIFAIKYVIASRAQSNEKQSKKVVADP